jgi:P4 family phage/plasmid primase-like protien
MIDLNTGKLSPHDPKYGSRTRVPCHFNPEAQCERWFKFLEEIFPGNEEKRDLLQKFFGYCLLSDCRFERSLFLYGEGANGKGTVLHVLRAMVGGENTSSLTMKDLGDPKFSIYFLQGKLVNVATETSARDPLATEMWKTIVSGEPVTCEMKFGHKFQFSPFVKFVIAMNEPPVIPDKTYGFERRLLVLGFNERFEGEKKDVGLKDKLIEEIDGVFIWALQGLNKLLTDRDFIVGESVRKEHSDFLKELNPIIDFFDETVDPDPDDAIEISSFYKTYQVWCRDKGVRQLALKRFNREVLRQFPSVNKDRYGKNRRAHFIGLSAKVSLFKSAKDNDDEEHLPF